MKKHIMSGTIIGEGGYKMSSTMQVGLEHDDIELCITEKLTRLGVVAIGDTVTISFGSDTAPDGTTRLNATATITKE